MSLGSIMASGYIMRTNCRVGRARQPVRSLVWATCNDEEALRTFRKGFIFDRFTNQLYCPLSERAGKTPPRADLALRQAGDMGSPPGGH
jgi:hypothetical protein